MSRRSDRSLAASPVVVGAVTLLVAFVGVFMAYNANSGLPFVPTYDVKAKLLTGSKLVKGNDVRIGGRRVGTVTAINPHMVRTGGRRRAVALISMSLDKDVEPLPSDTHVRVRPRSALGLKYVELTPGGRGRPLRPGDTFALARSTVPMELEDLYGALDGPVRTDLRQVTEQLGEAAAGRGVAVNEALAALEPFTRHLLPVSRALADSDTDLRGFTRELGALFAQLAPVAVPAAEGFTHGADTLAAATEDPGALRATIERAAPAFGDGARDLRAARPFLSEATGLARRLETPVALLPTTLPPLNRALRSGTRALVLTPAFAKRLDGALGALDRLFANPATLMSLRDLRASLAILRPALGFVAPYQTVCNFAMYFIGPLGEHQSQVALGGTTQQQQLKEVNLLQPNTLGTTFSARPWDLQPGEPAHGAQFGGQPAGRLHVTPYQPAVDAKGRADCQNGQVGFPNYRITEPFVRDLPGDRGVLADGTPAGGNAPIAISDYPGRVGGTYRSRELGIDGLEDVP